VDIPGVIAMATNVVAGIVIRSVVAGTVNKVFHF